MGRKSDKVFDAWLKSALRLDPRKVLAGTRDVLRQIHGSNVALPRTIFVRRLNSETVVAQRRMDAGRDKVTTNQTVEKWVEAGCPVNEDGTISPLEVCAFLACERKDGGGGRPSLSARAGQGEMNGDERRDLVDRMRVCVDQGDVVGLIGLLLNDCPDLQTAEAVSKIVMNIIGAEKSRVKAQADEYDRKIRSGELLEARDVEQGRMERARYIHEALSDLGGYAPRLQGKSITELRSELEEIGRDLLTRLAGSVEVVA
jgi:hypothetical protein